MKRALNTDINYIIKHFFHRNVPLPYRFLKINLYHKYLIVYLCLVRRHLIQKYYHFLPFLPISIYSDQVQWMVSKVGDEKPLKLCKNRKCKHRVMNETCTLPFSRPTCSKDAANHGNDIWNPYEWNVYNFF